MGFRCRFVYMILLLLLLFILWRPSVVTCVYANNESSVISNSFPSESIEGNLQSFDVSQTGEILLFFQDASPNGICTVQIMDFTGKFVVEYIVTTAQSGSVLACFDDNGDVLLHYVRTEGTYAIKDNMLERVLVPEDCFRKTELPPYTQKGSVSHSFGGARYTLSTPGVFGSEYTLTRWLDSGEQLIWTGGADYIREDINRSLLFIPVIFSIISIVCIGTVLKDIHWTVSAKVLVALHVCVIVAVWIFILLVGSEKCRLSWQSINSVSLLIGVLAAVVVMILCDCFLLCRAIKPASPITDV